jgi:hypothetical protein
MRSWAHKCETVGWPFSNRSSPPAMPVTSRCIQTCRPDHSSPASLRTVGSRAHLYAVFRGASLARANLPAGILCASARAS